MAPDQRPTPLNNNQALIDQARALIKQRRWLDADDVLNAALRQRPGDVVLRAELRPRPTGPRQPRNAALRLLAPCIKQAITNPSLNGLLWRARVRAAESSAQAAQRVREALSSGQPLPNHVIEEWRMIATGLIQAGWHQEAKAWLNALGPLAEELDLAPHWSQRPAPTANDPDLDLDRLSTQMVLHPAAELQRKAQAFNQAHLPTLARGPAAPVAAAARPQTALVALRQRQTSPVLALPGGAETPAAAPAGL